MTDPTTDRWVEVQGGSNVRDLGGLPLADGSGRTAAGVAYRSDTLQELTADDAAAWRARGLRLVVDLRTPREAEVEGRGPLADVAYLNAPLLPDQAFFDPQREVVVHDPTPEQRAHHYLGYLRGEGGQNAVRAVTAIAAADGPVLFHCAAGKDRTGLLAALLLDLAGAERDAVVADYALTDERLVQVLQRLARRDTYLRDVPDLVVTEEHVEPFRCRPETMRLVLGTLDEEHGGAAGWLAAHGVPADALAGLRARLRGEA